ncbi:MAG: ABC transporter transmembrane domain-containing protein [Chloroflexaceae bacterium]|nr:ABC transporter transmembrane domain-containing protein [Chloroflexaceae bacterium]
MMIHRRLFALTAGVRGRLALLVLLGLLITATYVGQGIVTALVIGQIVAMAAWQAMFPLILAIVLLVLTRAVLQWFEQVGAKLMVVVIKEQLRDRLYTHLLHLGVGYLARERSGTVQATILDGVQHLEGYLSRYIPQCFVAILGPIPIIAFLYLVNPVIAVVVVICMVLVPVAPAAYSRLLSRYGQQHWEDYSTLNAQFLDAMQGMTTLKAFNASERQGRTLQADTWQLYRSTMLQMLVSLIGTGFIGLLTGAGTAAAIGIGSLNLASGAATMTALLLILLLVGECFRPLLLLDRYWHIGFMGLSASDGIARLLDARPEAAESATAVEATPTTTRPTLTLSNVALLIEILQVIKNCNKEDCVVCYF